MAQRLRVVWQIPKIIINSIAAGALAFSSLALAGPLLFSSSALAETPVVINELSSNGASDWVEVYNPTTSAIDISSLSLKDSAGNSGSLNATTIPGHGYAVASFGNRLNDAGDSVSLYEGSSAVETVSYGTSYTSGEGSASAPASGQSLARTTNGGATWATSSPSENASNDPSAELSVCASGCDYTDIASAVALVAAGGTVFLDSGSYSVTSTLTIAKAMTIEGAGENETTIDTSGVVSGYGVYTNVDNVSIQDLAITGPSNATGYGLKIEGSVLGGLASGSNIIVKNVSVSGSYKTGIDLNGINGATLTNVSSIRALHGNGLAITDSHNIQINGVETSNNLWGGIAIYANGNYYACGVDNVTLTGANNLSDPAALYTGIDNTSNPACTITNLHVSSLDLPYKVALNNNDPQDVYTTSLANAGLVSTIYSSFSPVVSSSGDSTSLWVAPGQTAQSVIDVAQSGDTINIPAGTYDGFSVNGKSNLTIVGAGSGSTIVAPTTLINSGIQHKYTANMLVSLLVNNSSNISLQDMTVKDNGLAPGYGGPDALVFWDASTGNLTDDVISAGYTINGIQSGQGIAVDAGGNQNADLTLNKVAILGFQKNGIDVINGNGATSGATGTINLTVNGGSITGAGSTSAIAQNGLVLWDRAGGTVTSSISGATISGFQYTPLDISSGDNGTGILTYGTSASATVSDSVLTNSDLDVSNATASGTFKASLNWWGSSDPNFSAIVGQASDGYSPVTTSPYFTNSAMTIRSDAKVVPDSNGNATVNNSTPQVVVASSSQPLDITVTSGTNNASIDFSSLVTHNVSNSTAILPQTFIQSTNAQVSIPASTVVTANDTSWDGVVDAPQVLTDTSVPVTTPSGYTTTLGIVIKVGSDTADLTFNAPVEITIPNQAGKSVGFVKNGVFTQIKEVCSGSSPTIGELTSNVSGACSLNSGNDIVIWTSHFTEFVTYSQTPVSTSKTGPSSSFGPSQTPIAQTASANTGSSGESTSSSSPQVLGTTNSGQPRTSSAHTKAPVPKAGSTEGGAKTGRILGLLWYWWIPIILAIAIVVWIFKTGIVTISSKS